MRNDQATSKSVALLIALTLFGVPIWLGVTFLVRIPTPPVSEWTAVTSLDAIPNDGRPHRFPVTSPRFNAWNRLADGRDGDVFLRHDREVGVVAMETSHYRPMRMPVVYSEVDGMFYSPCRNLYFGLDGKNLGGFGTNWNIGKLQTKIENNIVHVRTDQVRTRLW